MTRPKSLQQLRKEVARLKKQQAIQRKRILLERKKRQEKEKLIKQLKNLKNPNRRKRIQLAKLAGRKTLKGSKRLFNVAMLMAEDLDRAVGGNKKRDNKTMFVKKKGIIRTVKRKKKRK